MCFGRFCNCSLVIFAFGFIGFLVVTREEFFDVDWVGGMFFTGLALIAALVLVQFITVCRSQPDRPEQ